MPVDRYRLEHCCEHDVRVVEDASPVSISDVAVVGVDKPDMILVADSGNKCLKLIDTSDWKCKGRLDLDMQEASSVGIDVQGNKASVSCRFSNVQEDTSMCGIVYEVQLSPLAVNKIIRTKRAYCSLAYLSTDLLMGVDLSPDVHILSNEGEQHVMKSRSFVSASEVKCQTKDMIFIVDVRPAPSHSRLVCVNAKYQTRWRFDIMDAVPRGLAVSMERVFVSRDDNTVNQLGVYVPHGDEQAVLTTPPECPDLSRGLCGLGATLYAGCGDRLVALRLLQGKHH
jgi:hypothetical protein